MSYFTLLDIIIDNNALPNHGWALVGLMLLTVALIFFAAFRIVRRILLGRERARKLDEQRRDDERGGRS